MMISSVDRLRLAALLGMLGSNHVGERENAAQLVERFRRQRGFDWADLLGRPPAHEDASVAQEPRRRRSFRASSSRAASARPIGARDVVWRWSMLAGLVAVGLMALTALAQLHAAGKRIAAEADGWCPEGAC